MTDPMASPPDRELSGRPRWVTAFIVIGAVFVLAVVILALAGGHSPGRHG